MMMSNWSSNWRKVMILKAVKMIHSSMDKRDFTCLEMKRDTFVTLILLVSGELWHLFERSETKLSLSYVGDTSFLLFIFFQGWTCLMNTLFSQYAEHQGHIIIPKTMDVNIPQQGNVIVKKKNLCSVTMLECYQFWNNCFNTWAEPLLTLMFLNSCWDYINMSPAVQSPCGFLPKMVRERGLILVKMYLDYGSQKEGRISPTQSKRKEGQDVHISTCTRSRECPMQLKITAAQDNNGKAMARMSSKHLH